MDHLTNEKRSWNMGQVRSKNTKPELLLRSTLHKKGFRFRINGQVSKKTTVNGYLPGKPDIVLKKYKSVIFVHGCFWHQHKDCYKSLRPKTNIDFWNKKLDRNVQRDQENKKLLENLGWKVIIVWECQIYDNISDIMDNIERVLNES